MELFDRDDDAAKQEYEPLSSRMMPRTLEGFTGQEHILGEGKLLRRAIESDRLSSLILFGPPGTGKTALAKIIAARTRSEFVEANAVTIGVADIRKIIDAAKSRLGIYRKNTILLLDEIHHFNRGQQDALLPDVERGVIRLIGVTTENPYFYINPALISRSLVFEFRKLKEESLRQIILNSLKDTENGYGSLKIEIREDALMHIVRYSEGDARRALNSIEIGVVTTHPDESGTIVYDMAVAEESIQKKAVLYDKSGDAHYDHISAFIKSIRGSDPDAALYWMAKMLKAGEDPRFIARRIIIAASEDIGNADPRALGVAVSALNAVEFVGMPEARIILAQAVTYLATAPKSNASYMGLIAAGEEIENNPLQEVPSHLKDANLDSEALGHGKGYLYAHDFPGHFVKQEYMPVQREFYRPGDQGYEKTISERMALWKKKRNE